MAARDFRHPPQPAGRLRNHSRRALNQRLKDERRVGISLSFLRREFLFHQPDAFPVALAIFAGVGAFRLGAIKRTPIAIRRHDLVRLEQQTGITFVEQINVAERNRADGVAVICAFEGQELRLELCTATRRRAACAARAPGEFVGELERDFERGRTVVAEKKTLSN